MDLTRTKVDKNEAKKPDALKAELEKGFKWSVAHSKWLGIIVGGLLLIGFSYAGYNSMIDGKEKKLQGDLYRIESQIFKKSEGFEAALRPEPKDKDPKAAPAPVLEKATGDLQKDYGSLPEELRQFVEKNTGSVAGARGALTYSDLMVQYAQLDSALSLLGKFKSDNGLVSVLLSLQHANILVGAGQFDAAKAIFTQLLANKNSQFLAGEIHLKLGLVAEAQKNVSLARDEYKKATLGNPDSLSAKKAEKYLRLLNWTNLAESSK